MYLLVSFSQGMRRWRTTLRKLTSTGKEFPRRRHWNRCQIFSRIHVCRDTWGSDMNVGIVVTWTDPDDSARGARSGSVSPKPDVACASHNTRSSSLASKPCCS